MKTQQVKNIYAVTLILLDALLVGVAFILAYELRVSIPWPAPVENLAPLSSYLGLIGLQMVTTVAVLMFNRQYVVPRTVSRVDQFYSSPPASPWRLSSVAILAFIFKGTQLEVDYPRVMVLYGWLLSIILVVFGRTVHQMIRYELRERGIGKDRLVVVGTGDVARIITQRIQWSPQLGYELLGIIADDAANGSFLGLPILGTEEDLPALIEKLDIDEVIIAIPEKGHREVVNVSYASAGAFLRSSRHLPVCILEAGIDDLGGLPLLTVRNYALRGYMLIIKRLMDILGAAFGLIVAAPIMLLVAIAIKLESPGPAFFIQERMGLDGRPFKMIKFRSMRNDAERDGPGWTVAGDPRQTKLGKLLRRVDIDELPNLINVLLGEMSLVGPRPEQPYYVEEFRRTVPRYMDRHREKAGMTGWAQVNGLRGDTSIVERTKYDLWYTENWSPLLDIKIILRTIWQIVGRLLRRRQGEQDSGPVLLAEPDESLRAEFPAETTPTANGQEATEEIARSES